MHKILGLSTDWNRLNTDGSYSGSGWYRIYNPLEKLGAEIFQKENIGGVAQAVRMKDKGDIWMFKPTDSEGIDDLIFASKEITGAKLVMDLDDDPVNLDPEHPDYEDIKKKAITVQSEVAMADHVIVTTEPLKQAISDLNKNVTVIPNAIDPEIWKFKNAIHVDKKIRVGWIASGSHMVDLPIIHEVMQEILAKYPHVEFHMAGITPEEINEGNAHHHVGTKGYKDFPKWYAGQGYDIAVAPLKDSKFARAKSNIKWMEAAMLGIPCVASKTYPYETSIEHGKTGYLVDSKSQWVKHLSWLIESKTKREMIGAAAKKEVLAKYTIDKQLPKYKEVFDKIMKKQNITVYKVITGGKDKLKEAKFPDDANYICYTDQDIESKTWDIRPVKDLFKNARRNSRIYKLMPHKFFDTQYTVYLDGNIELLVSPTELVKTWLKKHDMAAFKHPGRSNIYDEADVCISYGYGEPDELLEQTREYAKNGISKDTGLCECGVLVRRNKKNVNEANERWWCEYCRHSERDQISFPVAFDLKTLNQIEPHVHEHPWFKFVRHEK